MLRGIGGKYVIKNCVIFRYEKSWTKNWVIDEDKVNRANLKNCMTVAQSRQRKRIESLVAMSRKESLSMASTTRKNHVFVSECEYRAPKLLAAGSSVFVPVSHKIWLRKSGSLVVSFDAGRKLSSIGVTLLSYATTGSVSAISKEQLDKNAFMRIKEWALSAADGHIKRITLSNVMSDKIRFKQIVLSSSQLESSELFDDLVESSSRVLNMSFTTPKLDASSRSLNCRLTHWGGLTIYTPDILDSEMSELIDVMERELPAP
jgi:hypothetical protein